MSSEERPDTAIVPTGKASDAKRVVPSQPSKLETFAEVGANIAAGYIPVAGPVVSAFVGMYFGNRREERIAAQIATYQAATGERFERLEAQTQDIVFRLLFLESGLTTEEEKLTRLRNAAINITDSDVEGGWRENLAECVREISTQEVAVLKRAEQTVQARHSFRPDELAKDFGADLQYVHAILTRLVRYGLLRDLGGGGAINEDYTPLALLAMAPLGTKFLVLVAQPGA